MIINDRGVQSAVSGSEAGLRGQQGCHSPLAGITGPATSTGCFPPHVPCSAQRGWIDTMIHCQIINSEKLITFREITLEDYVMGLFQF